MGFRHPRGANVIGADIDWGFRTTHDELRNAVARTYKAVDGGTDVTKGANAAHGTARKASRIISRIMRPADLTTLERSRLHEALVSAFYDAGRLGNLRAVAFSALRAVPFLAQLAR